MAFSPRASLVAIWARMAASQGALRAPVGRGGVASLRDLEPVVRVGLVLAKAVDGLDQVVVGDAEVLVRRPLVSQRA